MYKVVITLSYSFQSNNISYIFRRDRNMEVRLILIGQYGLCNKISLASIICILIFIGCLTAPFDLFDYKLLVVVSVKWDSFDVKHEIWLLRTNQIRAFCY